MEKRFKLYEVKELKVWYKGSLESLKDELLNEWVFGDIGRVDCGWISEFRECFDVIESVKELKESKEFSVEELKELRKKVFDEGENRLNLMTNNFNVMCGEDEVLMMDKSDWSELKEILIF